MSSFDFDTLLDKPLLDPGLRKGLDYEPIKEGKSVSDYQEGKSPSPSKTWRNKWVSVKDHTTSDDIFRPVGSVVWGSGLWPSKEVAEEMALLSHKDPDYTAYWGLQKYLGAFKVED